MIDVEVTRRFAASAPAIAAIMFDPLHDPQWIGGAHSVEVLTQADGGAGMKVRRHGGFLGKRFSWTTEVEDFERDTSLGMKVVDGPMRGSLVRYRIVPDAGGSIVSIRNRGSTGFSFPLMAWFLRRSVAKDLARLARLVEG